MSFSDNIERTLKVYRQSNKGPGFWSHPEHPAIEALRRLPQSDKQNPYKISVALAHSDFSSNKPISPLLSKTYAGIIDSLFPEGKSRAGIHLLLARHKMLTKENFQTLEKYQASTTTQNPMRDLKNILDSLEKVNLLNQASFKACCQHESPEEFSGTLFDVNKSNLLDKNRFIELFQHKRLKALAEAIKLLGKSNALTAKNLDQVLTLSDELLDNLNLVLNQLNDANRLTPNKCEELFKAITEGSFKDYAAELLAELGERYQNTFT